MVRQSSSNMSVRQSQFLNRQSQKVHLMSFRIRQLQLTSVWIPSDVVETRTVGLGLDWDCWSVLKRDSHDGFSKIGSQQLINKRSWGLTLIYHKWQYFRVNPQDRPFITTILINLHRDSQYRESRRQHDSQGLDLWGLTIPFLNIMLDQSIDCQTDQLRFVSNN